MAAVDFRQPATDNCSRLQKNLGRAPDDHQSEGLPKHRFELPEGYLTNLEHALEVDAPGSCTRNRWSFAQMTGQASSKEDHEEK
jgi:hypothetical protein